MSNGADSRVEFRALRPEERAECLALWDAVFPNAPLSHAGDPFFPRYFYGDVEWLPYYTQVAVADGRIVSAVHICNRVVVCGDFRLTLGGVANVATLPEHRGRGYNTECLRRAVSVMEADAMDVSLLFTGIPQHYARVGYEALPFSLWAGTVRPNFAPRPTPYRVREAADADLPAIHALHENYNRTRPLTVRRSEAYWRDWIDIAPGRVPAGLWVAEAAGRALRGYVLTEVTGREPDAVTRVLEFAAEDADVATALLESMAARSLALIIPKLRLTVPDEPDVTAALGGILTERHTETSPWDMARLLHRTNLLQSFTLELTGRWTAAGRPPGALTFATPYGPARLDATGPFLRVSETEDGDGAMPQATMLALLFGLRDAEGVAENREADGAALPLLHALFPPLADRPPGQQFVWWPEDGF